jgi:hypothetical protein
VKRGAGRFISYDRSYKVSCEFLVPYYDLLWFLLPSSSPLIRCRGHYVPPKSGSQMAINPQGLYSVRYQANYSITFACQQCSAFLPIFLDSSLDKSSTKCKGCIIHDFRAHMLCSAWHAGHDTRCLAYLFYFSLGTPCGSPFYTHEQWFLACGAECFTTGILHRALQLCQVS